MEPIEAFKSAEGVHQEIKRILFSGLQAVIISSPPILIYLLTILVFFPIISETLLLYSTPIFETSRKQQIQFILHLNYIGTQNGIHRCHWQFPTQILTTPRPPIASAGCLTLCLQAKPFVSVFGMTKAPFCGMLCSKG